jgi:hypothetical protein
VENAYGEWLRFRSQVIVAFATTGRISPGFLVFIRKSSDHTLSCLTGEGKTERRG